MPSKLSITVSLTIAPNSARLAVSGTLTAENASAVLAVARRVSGFDGGFNILIDLSAVSSPDVEALHVLQASGFRMAPAPGHELQDSSRPRAAAVPA